MAKFHYREVCDFSAENLVSDLVADQVAEMEFGHN